MFEPQAKKDMEVFVKLAMLNSEVSIIRTQRKNYIVCVWFNSTYFSDKVILFSQANATDLGMFTQMDINFYDLSQLLETDVYGYDYSGYGYSSGTPSEKNLYADIQAVYEHIRSSHPNKKIILMGFSMGTAASIDLASKQVSNLAGVVLISPFTSGLRLIRSTPAQQSTNCCDPFRSIDKSKLIDVPTLLIHGEMDDIVPVQHSVELHKQLRKPAPPLYLDRATHSNILCHEFPETINRIRKFIRKEI